MKVSHSCSHSGECSWSGGFSGQFSSRQNEGPGSFSSTLQSLACGSHGCPRSLSQRKGKECGAAYGKLLWTGLGVTHTTSAHINRIQPTAGKAGKC